MTNLPLLSLCLFWPVLGAFSLAFRNDKCAKQSAAIIAVIELCLTLAAWYAFDADNPDFQLLENLPWIANLNIHYQLGVDGISILFLPMTALLTLMAILAGWNSITQLSRFHLALLLLLEAVTIGVFTALDLALFFLFWELTLPPLFFLIGLWGIGAERRQAAMKYTLYMLFGGVPLLFGFMLLAFAYADAQGGHIPQDLCFSLPLLLDSEIPAESQHLIFLLLLLGFAVKAPLPPFHTWLPSVAMEAPTQVTALLTGLKLGLYGIIRFAIPLAPTAALEYRWLLATLGAVALIYAGLIALQQNNLRKLLAYAGVSHVGMVLLGTATYSLSGMQGAVMQLLNFGVVASALMLIAGMIQQRLGSNDLLHLGGLAKPMPRLTVLFFLFALSSIGVPGSSGFVAELLMFFGILQSFPAITLPALFGAVLAAAYMLDFIRHGFFGPVKHAHVATSRDLLTRELKLLAIPALLVLVLGLAPQTVLSQQKSTINAWLQRLHQFEPIKQHSISVQAKPEKLAG